VIEGLEEVDRIASVKTNSQDKPVEPQVMESVTVELFDYEYQEPVTK
jgi:peptidyl-prolyl cis-trans isomerase B (cyclophilin B)